MVQDRGLLMESLQAAQDVTGTCVHQERLCRAPGSRQQMAGELHSIGAKLQA